MQSLALRLSCVPSELERSEEGLSVHATTVEKFKESAWKLTVYGGFTALGLEVVLRSGWLADTTLFWHGWPDAQGVPGALGVYYTAELAFYVASIGMLLVWETRRQDFWVMLAHHVVTATLIALSLQLRFTRVGAAIMLLHDASDVLLESAKLANYSGHDRLSLALFVAFTLSWALLRLYLFPARLIHSTWCAGVECVREEELGTGERRSTWRRARQRRACTFRVCPMHMASPAPPSLSISLLGPPLQVWHNGGAGHVARLRSAVQCSPPHAPHDARVLVHAHHACRDAPAGGPAHRRRARGLMRAHPPSASLLRRYPCQVSSGPPFQTFHSLLHAPDGASHAACPSQATTRNLASEPLLRLSGPPYFLPSWQRI